MENDVMVDDDTVEARPFVWDGGVTLPRKYPSASRPQLQSYVAHDGSMTTLAASINAVTAVRVAAPAHRVAHRRPSRPVVALAYRPGVPANLGVARTRSLAVKSSPTRVRGERVLARAENDGRGKNPNEEMYGDGPGFGPEMIGVAIFLVIALQFFGTGFMG